MIQRGCRQPDIVGDSTYFVRCCRGLDFGSQHFHLRHIAGLMFEFCFVEEILGKLLRSLFGEEVLEYPRFYILLPDMQRRLYLLLAAFLGIYFQAVTMLRVTCLRISLPKISATLSMAKSRQACSPCFSSQTP